MKKLFPIFMLVFSFFPFLIWPTFSFAVDFSATQFTLTEITYNSVTIDISNVPTGTNAIYHRLFDGQDDPVNLGGYIVGGFGWRYYNYDGLATYRMYPNTEYKVRFYEDEAYTKEIRIVSFKTKTTPICGNDDLYLRAGAPRSP